MAEQQRHSDVVKIDTWLDKLRPGAGNNQIKACNRIEFRFEERSGEYWVLFLGLFKPRGPWNVVHFMHRFPAGTPSPSAVQKVWTDLRGALRSPERIAQEVAAAHGCFQRALEHKKGYQDEVLRRAVERIFAQPNHYVGNSLQGQLNKAGTQGSRARSRSGPPASSAPRPRSRSRSKRGQSEGRSAAAGQRPPEAQTSSPSADAGPVAAADPGSKCNRCGAHIPTGRSCTRCAPGDRRSVSPFRGVTATTKRLASRSAARYQPGGAAEQIKGKRRKQDAAQPPPQCAQPPILQRELQPGTPAQLRQVVGCAQEQGGSINVSKVVGDLVRRGTEGLQHNGAPIDPALVISFVFNNPSHLPHGTGVKVAEVDALCDAIAKGGLIPTSTEESGQGSPLSRSPSRRAALPIQQAGRSPPPLPGLHAAPVSPAAAGGDGLRTPPPSPRHSDAATDMVFGDPLPSCYRSSPAPPDLPAPDVHFPRRAPTVDLRVHLKYRLTVTKQNFDKITGGSKQELAKQWARLPFAARGGRLLPHEREMTVFRFDTEKKMLLLKHEFEAEYEDGWARWKTAPDAMDPDAELTLWRYAAIDPEADLGDPADWSDARSSGLCSQPWWGLPNPVTEEGRAAGAAAAAAEDGAEAGESCEGAEGEECLEEAAEDAS
eukprot:TRINITY_DN18945_c0_g1_i2.p1 TRINITY_DN18945_c0_g1~~TRINITY_DN18945_c0_g1_i2.p1  ORF type:complete len:686 (+),score=123.83 TRINITY_DN18945_c0_g1_i2:87-2060(+)